MRSSRISASRPGGKKRNKDGAIKEVAGSIIIKRRREMGKTTLHVFRMLFDFVLARIRENRFLNKLLLKKEIVKSNIIEISIDLISIFI